jgi:signal transduction histidine kinase/DNA-binding NarL/FixJ family response regulator
MDVISITNGVLVTLAVYNLFIFLGRGKIALSNLSYSLLFIVYVFAIIVSSVYPDFILFNIYKYYILTFIICFLLSLCLVFFTYTVFDLTNIKHILIVILIMYLCLAVFLYMSYIFTKNIIFINAWYILKILSVVILIFFITSQILKKKQYKERKNKFVIAGFILILSDSMMFSTWQILFSEVMPDLYTCVIFLSAAFIFSYALTDSFNKEYKDLQELKNNLEHLVNKRTAQLKEANKQKSTFFINLAHETKTPVTLINNYLDSYILKKGPSRESGIIKRNVKKLLNDIVNILDIEKLEAGGTFYNHKQIVNLSDIVKQKVMLFEKLKKDIYITAEVEENITLQIDPYAVDRILNNLIDNAFKYNREFGSVKVSLKRGNKKDKIELSVKDTGIGMIPEKVKHIFDPFYQISREKKNYEGLGIGLSIVKKIVDETGAEISVTSRQGIGTEFTILLNSYTPSSEDSVRNNLKLSKPADTLSDIKLSQCVNKAGRKNVFVVDDNLEMLAFLQDHIKGRYNFYFAVNGKHALEMLSGIPRPDIIISDIMMDVMDGYEFYEKITSEYNYKAVPFIFLTAKSGVTEELKGLNKGAVDFITKPFSIDVLMAKINSILQIQEKQKEAILNEMGIDLYKHLNKPLSREFRSEYDVLSKLKSEYSISRREMEVIRLIKEGHLYKEIASELDISLSTVQTYRHRIFKKCKVNNKIELFKIFSPKR